VINEFETLYEFEEGKHKQFFIEMESVLPEIYNIMANFEIIILSERQIEEQYHLHPEGQSGASNLGGCIYLKSRKWAGLPIPIKIGHKAFTGNARVGTHWHGRIIQPVLEQYYNSPGALSALMNSVYGNEIYVKFVLFEDEDGTKLVVVSPVDCCFVTRPGFFLQDIKFRNVIVKKPFKHPNANWEIIFDIKSASLFAYSKNKAGLDPRYKAQGHGYMFATGLKRIFFFFVNKKDGRKYFIELKWDQEFWEQVIQMNRRAVQLSKIMELTNGKAIFLPSDFAYCYADSDYECTYFCPLSETVEIQRGKDETILELVAPCVPCRKFVIKDAKEKFPLGSEWMKDRSHITIDAYDGDYIISTNKTQKRAKMGQIKLRPGQLSEFRDSIYYALKKYKPMIEKKQEEK
jgi:hypothetical protein